MDRQTELAIVRRAYAKQTLAAARITDPRIEAAFADVPREDFLGPAPGTYSTYPASTHRHSMPIRSCCTSIRLSGSFRSEASTTDSPRSTQCFSQPPRLRKVITSSTSAPEPDTTQQ